jgi:pimeloyl-ACP methyl ester carboxylesterase
MQRPVMDPMLMFGEEDAAVADRVARAVSPHSRVWAKLREAWVHARHAVRVVGRLLFSRPLSRRRDPESQQPIASRLVRAFAYRALFIPIFLTLWSAALVYRGTHPMRYGTDKLPAVPSMFYETLELNGSDGTPLMAWFVPVVDAQRVLELKNKVLKEKQPAVVLVHDFNKTPSQMVPLIAPLHERGFVVAVVGLRGAGRGGAVAQTFGLEESGDVRALIARIRQRPSVDPNRIAIVGFGTGANAAVIAAAQDKDVVKALVLVNPYETTDEVIAERIGPKRRGFAWMQQGSKWAFEMAYHVDADDLYLARFRGLLDSPVTKIAAADPGSQLAAESVAGITDFCVKRLTPTKPEVASTSGGN